ncbi:MAG: HPr family phosphocarrier protein [Kangiellaceae bacterium]|nr:HPr family phosphocarrier protein [Kangiellaceae bacterium]
MAEIVNRKGLHARAAAELVKVVDQFNSDIVIEYQGKAAPGNSLIHLLTLGAKQGSVINIKATGQQSSAAIDALSTLVARGFYEEH